jgi:hypothetical protein
MWNLSSRRPGFDSLPIHTGFMVGKVLLGQFFLLALQFLYRKKKVNFFVLIKFLGFFLSYVSILRFFMLRQPLVGLGLLVIEASLSHSDTPHSVGLLWTRDQPVAETSTWQHSQQTDIHALGGIRTRNPIKRAAVDPRLRPRGHWDRHSNPQSHQASGRRPTP